MARISNKEIMDQMATMNKMLESIVAEQKSQRMDIEALKGAKVETSKKSAPKSATKTAKSVSKKTSSEKTSTKKSAPVEAKKETKSLRDMKLADFEPKKYDGFYRWGMKTDGFNQKSYMGMRKAYCVYKATNGEYLDAQKAYNAGVRIDYSEGSAYFKAKEEFEKKFKYVKKSDR